VAQLIDFFTAPSIGYIHIHIL